MNLAVSGKDAGRIFNVTSNTTVTIANLNIANGSASGSGGDGSI